MKSTAEIQRRGFEKANAASASLVSGGVVVPFCCLARSTKAEKFLGPSSTALAEKTMPAPQ